MKILTTRRIVDELSTKTVDEQHEGKHLLVPKFFAFPSSSLATAQDDAELQGRKSQSFRHFPLSGNVKADFGKEKQ